MAFDQPPPEGDYLWKMPAGFRMIAPLLGDLDNSDGRGTVHYREDRSPAVLRRAGVHIRRAFPAKVEAEPLSTVVVTWEKMAAAGSSGRGDGLDSEVRKRVGPESHLGQTFQFLNPTRLYSH